MKEINIARAIIAKRKEKGITQDELANYIGVSKASVSKWETEQSYPDIVLLPQLAAFFNISIDELMGYEPQMTKEDVGKLYRRLYEGLSTMPFDEVIEQCRGAVKKYYSCFPLLLQMGDLLINASAINGDKERFLALVTEARTLFIRVKTESNDAELIMAALYWEAVCASLQGNPNEVIELLEKTVTPTHPHEILLASAYRLTERHKEAESVLQVGIHQNVVSTLGLLSTYAMLGIDDADRFDEIVKRTFSLAESFNIKRFQPSTIISFYVVAAQGYLAHQNIDRALDLLEQYSVLACGDISMQLKNDSFFNLVDSWLDEPDIGNPIPPHKAVKQSLVEAVVNNPFLSGLKDNPRFQHIVKKLESNN